MEIKVDTEDDAQDEEKDSTTHSRNSQKRNYSILLRPDFRRSPTSTSGHLNALKSTFGSSSPVGPRRGRLNTDLTPCLTRDLTLDEEIQMVSDNDLEFSSLSDGSLSYDE